jgi:hypothetical protein
MSTQLPGWNFGEDEGTDTVDELVSRDVAYALPMSRAAPMSTATTIGAHFQIGAVWADTTIPDGGGGR